MSNKTYDRIMDADREIRRICPVGMEDGTKLTIEFFCGFELFNTRPYHNYETWSGGYRVSGPAGPVGGGFPKAPTVTVTAEDLDDALRLFERKRDEVRAEWATSA